MQSKGKGLLLKGAVFLLANGYIFYRLFLNEDPLDLSMMERCFSFPHAFLYCASFLLLMPLNWLLESWKWKLLLRSLGYRVTIYNAVRAVLQGLAIGIFTPNRSGEFLGRIAVLPGKERGQGVVLSVFNALTQLTVTIGMACLLLGLHHAWYRGRSVLIDERLMPLGEMLIYSLMFLAFCFLLIYFLGLMNLAGKFGERIGNLLSVIRKVGLKYTGVALLISLARYFVFLLQYWLVLNWFGIVDPDWSGWVLIPMIFFVTSVIPGLMIFPIDVSVRGAAAIYFLSPVCADDAAIVFASLLIWAINIALPAFSGSLFWLRNRSEP